MATASALKQPELSPGLTSVETEKFYKLDSVVLYGTFSVLLLGPLAFGAVEPWAIFGIEVSAVGLFVLWAVPQIVASRIAVRWNVLFAPMLGFGVVLSAQVVFRTSAYRYATSSGAMLYVAYGLLLFLATQCVRRSSQVKTLAWIFTGYGSALAIFAIIQGIAGNGKIYWLRLPRAGGWIYGPYVSHNHYAGLMEMLFPIALVIALHEQMRPDLRWIPAFAAVLMASTIFLSGSRGGMIAFVIQTAALGIAVNVRKNRGAALMTGAIIVIVSALTLWVGGEGLISRIVSIHSEAKSELDTGLRLKIDRDGLRMFSHRPVLGWGLGTFPVVYPQFRSIYTNKFVNHAHDDYLQLLVETGAAGFLMMMWFVVRLYRQGVCKVSNWQHDLNGALALAALIGCTGILAHSFIDSNLQIPANAALFYTIAALAVAETKLGSHRRRHHHRQSAQQT